MISILRIGQPCNWLRIGLHPFLLFLPYLLFPFCGFFLLFPFPLPHKKSPAGLAGQILLDDRRYINKWLLSIGLDGRFAKDLLVLGFHKNREKFSANSTVFFQRIRISCFYGLGLEISIGGRFGFSLRAYSLLLIQRCTRDSTIENHFDPQTKTVDKREFSTVFWKINCM